MMHWLTFGRLPDYRRDPSTYTLVAVAWTNIAILVWAFSPWGLMF